MTRLSTSRSNALPRATTLYHLPIGYVRFDETGVIVQISEETKHLLDAEDRDLVGLPFPVLVTSEDVPLFLQHLKQCRGTGNEVVRSELRLRSAKRKSLTCELISVAAEDPSRRTFHSALIALPDAKSHERELRLAKEYAERLIEFMPEPLLVLDRNLFVLSANAAFRELTRCSTHEIAYRRVDQLDCVHWDSPQPITELLKIDSQRLSFQNVGCTAHLTGFGQKIFLLASARRLTHPADLDPVVVVAFKDVTERRAHEVEREALVAELQKLNADLEQRVNARTTELNAANARLQELSRRVVEAQEAERRALARELHDEIGQQLTGLSLLLNRVENEPAAQTPQTLAESRRIVGDLLARVRQMSGDLRPQVLDHLGLLVALKWHIKTYTQQTNIDVNFISRAIDETRLSPEVKITAFRVVQEALTNIARHAQVRRASVRILRRNGQLEIEIRDGGKGFDPATLKNGSGISGMRERVGLAGGTFAVESAPGQGVQLSVRLPMTAQSDAGAKA